MKQQVWGGIVVIFLIVIGQVQSVEIVSDWYLSYQRIEDRAATAFVERALSYARQSFGQPRLPVRKVNLCKSTPLDPASDIRRDFQLCEISHSRKGVFTIYLSRDPGEYAFWGQLAHEVAHLMNAQLFDVYVEGLNTAFAERLLTREGKDWSGWKTYLESKDRFYGETWRMMSRVWNAVGDKHIKTFLSFAVFSDSTDTRMHIDIDRWILSLPLELQAKVREILDVHRAALEGTMRDHPEYRFERPR